MSDYDDTCHKHGIRILAPEPAPNVIRSCRGGLRCGSGTANLALGSLLDEWSRMIQEKAWDASLYSLILLIHQLHGIHDNGGLMLQGCCYHHDYCYYSFYALVHDILSKVWPRTTILYQFIRPMIFWMVDHQSCDEMGTAAVPPLQMLWEMTLKTLLNGRKVNNICCWQLRDRVFQELFKLPGNLLFYDGYTTWGCLWCSGRNLSQKHQGTTKGCSSESGWGPIALLV